MKMLALLGGLIAIGLLSYGAYALINSVELKQLPKSKKRKNDDEDDDC